MKLSAVILILSISLASAFAKDEKKVKRFPASASFKVHRCESSALNLAAPFLAQFVGITDESQVEVAPQVVLRPSIKAPLTKKMYDVLELDGNYIKASYRMRFIFSQMKEGCVLVGQEIIEYTDI
ncbi:MAG: hypothetical protein ACXVLQ_15015 [Bacteriovorax sp.]